MPKHKPTPSCTRCGDAGYRWRVPDGFNPFSAGAFRTAAVAYKVQCECAVNDERPKQEDRDE